MAHPAQAESRSRDRNDLTPRAWKDVRRTASESARIQMQEGPSERRSGPCTRWATYLPARVPALLLQLHHPPQLAEVLQRLPDPSRAVIPTKKTPDCFRTASGITTTPSSILKTAPPWDRELATEHTATGFASSLPEPPLKPLTTATTATNAANRYRPSSRLGWAEFRVGETAQRASLG